MPVQAGQPGVGQGEALSDPGSDEADRPRQAPTDMGETSTPRTARCGPACRVVWEGTARQLAAPIPIHPIALAVSGF